MTATVRYPAGDLTPHGWWHTTHGTPMMRLRAYDGSIDFYLSGGRAIPDRFAAPESVHIPRDGLKGLIPPWKHIDQKGATQDGVSNIDALYDPIEVSLDAMCRGRDGLYTARVVRDLIAAIDAKQQSELSFLSPDLGYWWAPVRWFQGAPPNPLMGAQNRYQKVSLRLRADDGFWRTYDDTHTFSLGYDSLTEEFDFDDADDLGADWPVYFYEEGVGAAGHPYADGAQAAWSVSGTVERGAVIPHATYTSTGDDQVITIELGTIPDVVYPDGAYNDIWGRVALSAGVWAGDGVRARVGRQDIALSRFNSFSETVMAPPRSLPIMPRTGDKFSLVCGAGGDPRMFRVLRNGVPILSHKEVGTGSALGASYRGAGFGVKAAAGTAQASPAWVQRITVGDNTTGTQSGFFTRTNIGDQPMYDDYVCFGPFDALRIWDGPNAAADAYVEFGPLATGQVALLRTDPRDRNVYDLSTISAVPSQQQAGIFQTALNALFSFATAANIVPILSVIQSIFGIFGDPSAPYAPQGNLYRFLSGRFSDASAIPAKSPGNPTVAYHVKVEIVGGDADTKVIASGTPKRRYPL